MCWLIYVSNLYLNELRFTALGAPSQSDPSSLERTIRDYGVYIENLNEYLSVRQIYNYRECTEFLV